MVPSLAYVGPHERDMVNPEGITYRFIMLLAESDFDREELSTLPAQSGMIAKPFSVEASKLLMHNANVPDLFTE